MSFHSLCFLRTWRFSSCKRFEEDVGQTCEGASARQSARRFGIAASTVRAIDLRYLERWKATRRMPALKQMGVDEIFLGKKEKFIRSEEHTSELQSLRHLVCRLLLEKKKKET